MIVIASLVACGGGTGASVPPPTSTTAPTPTPTPTSTATIAPSTTNASGTVVADDGNGTATGGTPLEGISVKVMPWAPCGPTPAPATSITPESDGCPTPLPSPEATTNAQGRFTLNGVPNGHYLLVIGADAVATVPPGYTTPPGNCSPNPCPTPSPVSFTVQATVHDNVTLTGGNQMLKAPTLPTVPAGYTPPTWETNGDYRLATMNTTTEMPCLIAWQYERGQNKLAGSSVDEWLAESIRANVASAIATEGGTVSFLTTGNASSSGGMACAAQIVDAFAAGNNVYSANSRTLWFDGQFRMYSLFGGTNNEAAGIAEFPVDPRSYTDPNHPVWP